ncbi:hypothetical protein HJFPF1_12470 [Paramyrothecium foliicola]|nr:hypothetical protein HJFPF1_12470 [Paramyrothecium foliicola]
MGPESPRVFVQVYVQETEGSPRLTGAGYCSHSLVVADINTSVDYTSPVATLSTHRISPDYVTDSELSLPAFGIHDACWTLFVDRMAPCAASVRMADIVAHLHTILACISGSRHRDLDPTHDCGGTSGHLDRIGMHSSADFEEGDLGFLHADPCQVSLDGVLSPPWPATQSTIAATHGTGHSDIFTGMPRELVVAMCAELPSDDLCSLRLTSRAVAAVSSPVSLPNSFWHSRFAPDFEMGFYMAGKIPGLPSKDWRALYGQIRRSMAGPSGSPSLRNRRRIWNVLGDLKLTIEALLEGPGIQEAPFSYATGLPFTPSMVVTTSLRSSWQNPAYPSIRSDFSWDLEEAVLSNFICASTPIKIYAYFIHLHGQAFVCGLQATASTSTGSITLSQVGLIRPKIGEYFYLQPHEKITKVLAVCSRMGVVGLGFLIQATSADVQGETWRSLGSIKKQETRNLGVAELKTSGKIAFYCISVGIFELCKEQREDSHTILAPIWSPSVPEVSQFGSVALGQDTSAGMSKCCLDMNFGGPQGERLPLLNRITPFVDSGGLLRGMAFFYDDGTKLSFEDTLTVGCPDRVITRLFAQMKCTGSSIEKLDAQYIDGELTKPRVEITKSLVIMPKHLEMASYVNRYYRDASTSGVNLDQVQCVHFSRGADGHSRLPDNICGMLVEFWDSSHPLILGQWVEKVDGASIQFQQGERIVEIGIWYMQEDPRLSAPRTQNNCGRVAGIRVTTSNGQRKECRFTGANNLLFVLYQDNLFENITGLVWSFNAQYEFVQVLRSPSVSYQGTELVHLGFHIDNSFTHHGDRDMHDLVKLWWRMTEPQTGSTYKLTAIDAFYYHRADVPYHFSLAGLRFRYNHAVKYEVGRCTTGTRFFMESVEFGDDELVAFERSQEGRDDTSRQLGTDRESDSDDSEDADHHDCHAGMRMAAL